MANNRVIDKLLRDLFNPRPELVVHPSILVQRGKFIASVVLFAALSPPPDAGLLVNEYALYVFYVGLAVHFVLAIGLILLGRFLADAPGDYNALIRKATCASDLMLVVAVAVYLIYMNL